MKKVLFILLVLLLAFIWGNSCLSIADSRDESKRVMEIVKPVLEHFAGQGKVTLHMVRKLAHFTEFSALGAVLALLLPLTWKGRFLGAACGLLAGFLDETIQFFSDRGDQIIDVWLDFSGVIFGLLAGTLVYLLLRVWQGRRRPQIPRQQRK